MGKAGSYGRRAKTAIASPQRCTSPRRSRWSRRWTRPRRRSRRSSSRRRPRWTWWSRRTTPRQAPIFPQEKSLQVLRREDGFHRLQARRHPLAVRAGARQDSPAPHDRSLLASPALARCSHQARPQHRADALRRKRRRHPCSPPGSTRRRTRRARTSGSATSSRTGSTSRASRATGNRSAKNVVPCM